MRPTHGPELDVALLVSAFEVRIAWMRPAERDLALRTLRRLTPDDWTLEWYVPWWLGDAFGLGRDESADLVLSNVLGLVSIRLQDDLLDGDVADADVEAATRVGHALLDEALAGYRRRFEPGSPFWLFLERSLAEWRRASTTDGPLTWPEVARRGAPLTIAAFAICLMTDRLDRWDLVDRCLGHALAALVRYDHVCDWEDDLRGGRWNGFIAGISPLPQDDAHREGNRRRVQAALMTRGAAQAEFDAVRGDALRAARLAARLGCPPLAAHLNSYAKKIAAQGAAVEAHYRAAAERAAELMFGTSRPMA